MYTQNKLYVSNRNNPPLELGYINTIIAPASESLDTVHYSLPLHDSQSSLNSNHQTQLILQPSYTTKSFAMPLKAEVRQRHYGVKDIQMAYKMFCEDSYRDPDLQPLVPLSSFTKMSLPYEAPSHPELPTMNQIEEALKNKRISDATNSTFPVCRIGNVVIKVGYDEMILQEAEDLLFLQENSQVRTPKVYAVFSQGEEFTRPYFMAMQFLEGDTITTERWEGYSEDARTKICASISEQLRLLRSVPSEGYYGRVNKQGWRPRLSLLRTRGQKMNGPYATYEDFVSAVYDSGEFTGAMNSFGPEYSEGQEECLAVIKPKFATCKGRQPTLTHLDPAGKNILVRQVNDDWEATFIDWADCGWYPAYMQRVAFHIQTNFWDKDTFRGKPEVNEQFLSKVLKDMEDPDQELVDLFRRMDLWLVHGLL
jgi:hypothetical protein